jgi:hypothetical protein
MLNVFLLTNFNCKAWIIQLYKTSKLKETNAINDPLSYLVNSCNNKNEKYL